MSSQGLLAIRCLIIGLVIATFMPQMPQAAEKKPDSQEDAQVAKDTVAERQVTQGALRIIGDDGSVVECPLKHTDVKADVSGFIARVHVTQTFHNPMDEKIEAVYVFPLPHEAAVDEMTMVIGERKIVGVIRRRDEARRIYEEALMHGQTAALLEQERPNIFTQSVGNIAPGQEVKIQISYVDVLKYDMGEYEFHFPMVVGPRFIPGAPVSSPQPTPQELQGKVSPPASNTTRVPDAERITPPVLRPKVRNGHDISLTISLDAGVPVQNLSVANHEAKIDRDGDRRATVKLSPADSLPNKDFVVRYAVVGEKPEMAVIAHTGNYSGDARKLGSGYFMLMIQPKEDERLKKSPPREMVFLVDVSGSMRGAKTAKTRETMQHMLGLCREKDTVQVVTFAGQAHKLFEKPLPVGEESIKRALNFTSNLRGSGGTHMLQGVRMAIDEPIDQQRVRIVVMLTDGFIGNEAEIIAHVGKNCGDQIRFWAIGIGQSPNMFLVDGVAKQGGGMGKRLGLNDEAESLSHEVMTRIQRAQLANVKIDWGNMAVLETYPARIPELWAGRPVIVFGRYRDGGQHQLNVTGTIEGEPASWPLMVELPKTEAKHDVLAIVWAREKIEDLMHQSYYAGSPAVEEEVTALALDYQLMSQYTSFVAVDENDADQLQPVARPPRRMLVPVPLPEGAEWEGFFGEQDREDGELAFGVRFSVSGVVRGQADKQIAPGRGRGGGLGGGGFGGRRGWAYQPQQLPRMNRQSTQAYFLKSPGRPTPAGATAHLSLFDSGTTRGSRPALGLVLPGNNRRVVLNRLAEVKDESEAIIELATVAGRTQASQFATAAQAAMKSAKEMQEQGDTAARDAFVRACFLDQAAANSGYSPGQIAAEAMAAVEEIDRKRVRVWTKQQPVLAKRLDLVIRDQSIDEALQRLAEATGMTIELTAGSVDDAVRLTHGDVRVSYLDLRGATAAQSLDWILRPARLSWRVDNDTIIAGADRRLAGTSAWVYDVSNIALLSSEEAEKLKDKAVEDAKKAVDDFVGVVRRELKIEDEREAVWFAPGQLLVFGTPDRHELAAKLFSNLADPTVQLEGEAAQLHRVTSKRAQQNKDLSAKLSAARQRIRAAQSHADFGWQLLAAAADGRPDDEAVTELKIAWNHPATMELLAVNGRALAMRSLWMVTEASRALPDEHELAALAETARRRSQHFAADTVELVQKDSEDAEAFAALLYAALALRDDADLRATARRLLTKSDSEQSPLGPARLLAEALLAEGDKTDHAELVQLVIGGVSGEDMVMLTALACRRAGGETWQTFRAEARDLLGSQPLPGHVVVAILRLSQDRLLMR